MLHEEEMSSNPNIISEQANPTPNTEGRALILFEILEAMERRSFVPFIAVPALIGLTPLGSTLVFAVLAGLLFVWVGGQLLIGHTFPVLPKKIAYTRFNSPIAHHFTMWLLEMKEWLEEIQVRRLSWLTTSVFATLPYFVLILVGLALPVLVATGQSTFLIYIAALIYCVALVNRDGRYILASASVISFASIGPLLAIAS